MNPALEFESMVKSFAGVQVLRGVSFQLAPGSTLGLVGENGAGKSTLMNILGGNLKADSGQMRLRGQPYAPTHPTHATQAGIAFIHQELNLFPNLTIAENLFLTAFPTTAGFLIRRGNLRRQAGLLLTAVGLPHSPDTPVELLSPGERQLVEIARALTLDTRILILDEPTTSLSTREIKTLFALLSKLRSLGVATIFISHILDHILQLCDDLVILRDGAVVAQGPASDFNIPRIVSKMVGRELSQLYPSRQGTPSSEPVLELKDIVEPGLLHHIDLTVHRGEILGLSGLMGAGRTELARVVFGLDPHQQGEILLEGVPLQNLPPQQRIAKGLAFLTEDRREEGLFMEASIADNLTLPSLPAYARTLFRWLDFQKSGQAAAQTQSTLHISAHGRGKQLVKTLSGGNQQKVVLGKWLLTQPTALILDEPTRGVDVGAKWELYRLILELADQGTAVLVISSEIEELMGICDRILVMSQGTLRAEFPREDFDRENILTAAIPQEKRS